MKGKLSIRKVDQPHACSLIPANTSLRFLSGLWNWTVRRGLNKPFSEKAPTGITLAGSTSPEVSGESLSQVHVRFTLAHTKLQNKMTGKKNL